MNLAQAKNPNSDAELQRTQRTKHLSVAFCWEMDILLRIGYERTNMSDALSPLTPKLKESFKQATLAFVSNGDYSPGAISSIFAAVNTSLKRYPTSTFSIEWASQVIDVSGFINKIGAIRNFFIFWKSRDPQAISDEALQLFAKTKAYARQGLNVLSDDPEKSWLSDEEYEALLSSIWRNYEDGVFSTSRTLMLLLSMQYGRRPVQLSQLKLKDFRIAAPSDASDLSGPVVSFPGVKDSMAETGFRDSKLEHHPLPTHLWKLFEIQRNEVRTLFELKLGKLLTDDMLENLPLFVTEGRLKVAVSALANHYGIDFRTQLDHQLFHDTATTISRILAWKPSGHRDIDPPLSHRTGRPIVVNATRIRHTRARQLARKGVPLHVLSHWLGHTKEKSITAYYNDPAEDARKLDEAMSPVLMPLSMAFAGNLIDSEEASRKNDPTSRLEFANSGELKNVGNCGNHSFCATTSIPIPCYRCRHFEPLVTAPHEEVLEALKIRQEEEHQALRIGGARNLLVPINLSADILAVQNCIDRCNAYNKESRAT